MQCIASSFLTLAVEELRSFSPPASDRRQVLPPSQKNENAPAVTFYGRNGKPLFNSQLGRKRQVLGNRERRRIPSSFLFMFATSELVDERPFSHRLPRRGENINIDENHTPAAPNHPGFGHQIDGFRRR